MSLLENYSGNRVMTLDNRTFEQCSQRMQRINPTLPKNAEKYQEPKEGDNEVLVLPKITIKAPTPEPPPRKKKQGTKDKKDNLKMELGTSLSMVNSIEECSWNSSGENNKQTRGIGRILHEYILKRPALIFLDWMTLIADNMAPSCPL